jgi:hypothetical protein
MKRRQFVKLSGGAAMLAMAGYVNYGFGRTTEGLVDTPKQRMDYTRELLKKLCTDIGPRPTGSEAFSRGAKIIRNEMLRSLKDVEYDVYKFDRWILDGTSEFIVGGQHIEAISAYGGKGTPSEGIHGILQRNKNGFELVDESTGERKAIISIAPFGKGITHYQSIKNAVLPSFSVGKQDVPLLNNAVRDRRPSWLKASVRIVPGAQGSNIIGKLPGDLTDEILFLAHADTVYNSPGANDNTASVIVMLMLAHAASGRKRRHPITFVATDGEEFGHQGAEHYAQTCKEINTMKNFRYVVNFDSLTYGLNLQISSKDEDLKDILRDIHKDLQIKATPNFDDKTGFVMDSGPFSDSGAKALHANSRGYDEKTLPVYHRPDDTADMVPLDSVEVSFLVFDEFIKRIDKL